ncbi:MAG: tetratricopeptide repeat protein [Acidobacteria bacterium]|nr:tetratricopeptide repeat protein [Acidobacteriota bacterium]
MKFLALLLVLLFLVTTGVAQDPTKIAPDAYKTEFENEYVRVQRVHYAPHVKIPEHDHAIFGTAYVYLNDAGPVVYKHIGLAYGAVTRPAVKAGSFRLYKAVRETHEVESLSDTPSDFLRVEFKTEPARDQNTLRGKYFREDSPAGENLQKVQFENDQVRITRLVCAAGKRCLEIANASEPMLFVALSAAKFDLGQARTVQLTPGQTHWIPAGKSVAGENISNSAAELLRFDFKTPPMKNVEAEKEHTHPHSPKPEESAAIPGLVGNASKAEALSEMRRGVALEKEGKIAESIAAHEQAVMMDPGLLQAHVNLISLYGGTGQFAKAQRAYQKAIEINPDIPEIHYNYGVLLVGQEQFAEAAQAFQECLRLNPYYAEAHHNYAKIIERHGKLDEAAEHYRKAIEIKTDFAAAHFHLGRILVNQGKLAEAIGHFQKSLAQESNDTPKYLYALGATYIRAGDKAKGIQTLRDALKKATAMNQTQLASSLERDLKSLEQDK